MFKKTALTIAILVFGLPFLGCQSTNLFKGPNEITKGFEKLGHKRDGSVWGTGIEPQAREIERNLGLRQSDGF